MKQNYLTLVLVILLFIISTGCISDGDEIEVENRLKDSLFPEAVEATDDALTLDEVQYWGYVIQDIPDNMDELKRSRYEMLVIEPTRTDHSDASTRSFDTRSFVRDLKSTAGNDRNHRKSVIAYIDIGQAEDWRWYWQWSVNSNWDPNREDKPSDWPSWIITYDPEWEGNFPVAYWEKGWEDIVINGNFSNNGQKIEVEDGISNGGEGYNSILDEVIKDGFDGIYLDWVEAFSEDSVMEAATRAGVDPIEAMFDLIEKMREYGRNRFTQMGRDPEDWVIIQQNAPDLSETNDERKFTIIDAIAIEGAWWEGTGDSGWDDPNGYDVSSKKKLGKDWYEDVLDNWLPRYQENGIPIFVCEYALAKADEVYNELAPENGFIPYCTRRSLSELSTTPPYFES